MDEIVSSIPEIVRQMLLDEGLVSAADDASEDWPVFFNKEPSEPDNVITLFGTGMTDDGRYMRGLRPDHPTFQVRVRADSYTVGIRKGRQIESFLESVYMRQANMAVQDVDGTDVAEAITVQCISFNDRLQRILGQQDEDQRLIFVMNCQATLLEY